MSLTRERALANVPDLEQRREAERLWKSYSETTDALYAACIEAGVDTDNIPIDRADLLALKAASDAAYISWNDDELSAPLCCDGDFDDPYRCALTGLMILENDCFLQDENTYERVLKVALGWPLDEDTGEFVNDVTAAAAAAAGLSAGSNALTADEVA